MAQVPATVAPKLCVREQKDDFDAFFGADGQRFAPFTDDTQMAEIVLRALIEGERNGSGLDVTMKLMPSGFAEWSVNPQGGHRALEARECAARAVSHAESRGTRLVERRMVAADPSCGADPVAARFGVDGG